MYLIRIQGIVQGVGFRPYIYRKCRELGLKGYVRNTGNGVEILIDDIKHLNKILDSIPSGARIDNYEVRENNTDKFSDFRISQSDNENKSIEMSPDMGICDECLKELRDRKDRRHDYFFITCTNCGPRYSTIESLPYDRKNTSMKDFDMCTECRKEYSDPSSRRYHAQTIACKNCGPALKYLRRGKPSTLENAIEDILSGEIVSIKGIGGFHIACLAGKEPVENLRKITGRHRKPFAVMAKDIRMAENICHISDNEKITLESPQRPILILRKKRNSDMAYVSELDTLGIMLPYTPLHHLLFDNIEEPLVMTSSNFPGNPITIDESSQFTDNILTNERRITNRLDDSLIKVVSDKTLMLRRSRGFVPSPIRIDTDYDKTILSLGAEMNNTISVYKDGKVYLSQYIGDTSDHETLNSMKNITERLLKLLDTDPDIITCDMHPSYNSSSYASDLSEKFNVPLKKIQHHKAHAGSVELEHGIKKSISVVCDGTGYGEDGNIWGGEVFAGDERFASFEEHIMPGGEKAIRYPWRMLSGVLSSFLSDEELEREMKPFCNENESGVIKKQIKERFNSPLTTSCGRILDAAASFLGLCDRMHYDARPAMLLESISSGRSYDIHPVIEKKDRYILRTTPVFEFLIENREKDKARLAATVHRYISEGIIELANKAENKFGELPRTFPGGVAYNRHITGRLLEEGFLVNEKVPCGDGGISFGQIGSFLHERLM